MRMSSSGCQKRSAKPKDVGYEVAYLKYEIAKLRAEVLAKNIIIKKTEITKEVEEKQS